MTYYNQTPSNSVLDGLVMWFVICFNIGTQTSRRWWTCVAWSRYMMNQRWRLISQLIRSTHAASPTNETVRLEANFKAILIVMLCQRGVYSANPDLTEYNWFSLYENWNCQPKSVSNWIDVGLSNYFWVLISHR